MSLMKVSLHLYEGTRLCSTGMTILPRRRMLGSASSSNHFSLPLSQPHHNAQSHHLPQNMFSRSLAATISRAVRASPFRAPQRRTNYTAPMNEVRFLLSDVWNVEEHYKKIPNTGGLNADKDMTDMVLTEMAKFCEQELSPLNETADVEGCTWVDEHNDHADGIQRSL